MDFKRQSNYCERKAKAKGEEEGMKPKKKKSWGLLQTGPAKDLKERGELLKLELVNMKQKTGASLD